MHLSKNPRKRLSIPFQEFCVLFSDCLTLDTEFCSDCVSGQGECIPPNPSCWIAGTVSLAKSILKNFLLYGEKNLTMNFNFCHIIVITFMLTLESWCLQVLG